MLQYFINPWMLAGLAGVSLPIIAHLLSKKKYDIVQWGAMQFLELGRNAKRRLRLEQLLLMLLRMGLIALIVFAVARPWARGGIFNQLATQNNRDVAIIIDGSYSMGWEGRSVTPHQAAVRWAHDFLEDLQSGDTVGLIDARDRVRPVIETPTRDLGFVREQLDQLPAPSGSTNLSAAVSKALSMLNAGSNSARDIVVLTDGQALGWHAEDKTLWSRVDELRKQAKFPPRIWVVDVAKTASDGNAQGRTNFSVDRVQLSRDLTVPGFPVRLKSKVQYHGTGEPITRKVHLEVDGQRLADKQQLVTLQPNGEASLEFEYRFPSAGSHVMSIALEADNLPGDNQSEAAVIVAEAVPVLLVDGDPNLDPTVSETFFLKAALSPSINESPLVQSTVVNWNQFDPAALEAVEVCFLADVPRLGHNETVALRQWVKKGGGLVIAPGDKADAAWYNEHLAEAGQGLLPAHLVDIDKDEDEDRGGLSISDTSLELPWLAPFRRDRDGEFFKVRYAKWWQTRLVLPPTEPDAIASTSVVGASYETLAPYLIMRNYGKGGVMLLTSPLDLNSSWNTLAARRETFVPLMHEMVFHLASRQTFRNVDTGMPLTLEVPKDLNAANYVFDGPGDLELPGQASTDEDGRQFVRLSDTQLPGVYNFRPKNNAAAKPEYFVVNFDRSESDLSPLSEEERLALESGDRVKFIAGREELKAALADDAPRAELFRYLMLIFLAFLVFEVVMTRRLVRGGHAEVEPEPEPDEEPEEELVVVEEEPEHEFGVARMWSPEDERRKRRSLRDR